MKGSKDELGERAVKNFKNHLEREEKEVRACLIEATTKAEICRRNIEVLTVVYNAIKNVDLKTYAQPAIMYAPISSPTNVPPFQGPFTGDPIPSPGQWISCSDMTNNLSVGQYEVIIKSEDKELKAELTIGSALTPESVLNAINENINKLMQIVRSL